MPTLRIKLPNNTETVHQLSGDTITVGREPDNTIQIKDRVVSAHHAEIIAADGHYRLHDLGSTNLTFVDGEPVTDFHLHGKCKIVFGTVECFYDPLAGAGDDTLMTREQLERDAVFLRAMNADLQSKLATQQRRIDMLASARLVTGRTDSTPSVAAQDALRAVTSERDDLRHSNAGLHLELANLREELADARRERDETRRMLEQLRTEKVGLARELQELRGARTHPVPPMNGAPVRPAPRPGAMTSRDPGSALTALDPSATQRLTPVLSPLFEPIAATLAPLRSALDRVSGVPDDDASRLELMALATQLVDCAAGLDDHPIARVAASVEALLHEQLARPGVLEAAAARTVTQALDLLARLVEPRHVERAKTLPQANVLAVDDDAENLAMLVASLEMAQLPTTSCADAGAVLAQAGGRKFDLVLLDYDLAGSTAPALCAQLRGQSDYRTTPIIFLTGENGAEQRRQGSLNGGSDFMAKPVNTAELAVKAQTWILKSQFGLL